MLTSLVVASAATLSCGDGGDQILGTVVQLAPAVDAGSHQDVATFNMEAGSACKASTPQPGKRVGLNLYLAVDSSQSMFADGNKDKWETLVNSLFKVFQSSDLGAIGFAIKYFPAFSESDPCAACQPGACDCFAQCGCPCPNRDNMMGATPMQGRGCGGNRLLCAPDWYQRPDVAMAPLFENTSPLIFSLMREPAGPSVLGPALFGAANYVAQFPADHPDQRAVGVVIAGGPPVTAACPQTSVDSAISQTRTLRAKTYVIAFGVDSGRFNDMASAGGTSVISVDARPKDASNLLLPKFQEIVRTERCDYLLPDTTSAGQGRVNLQLKSPSGTVTRLYQVPACQPGKAGWMYDSPFLPSRIITCDKTCSELNAVLGNGAQSSGTTLQIETGCPTETTPPASAL